MFVEASRDVTLSTANESASAHDQHQHSSSGILSASSTKTDDASSYSNQIGSTFSGNATVLAAGRDASIIGSDVVPTKGTQVTAGNDLNIVAATNTSSESHYRKEITSGVFSGGGLGVTVGSKMQSTDFTRNTTTASGSTVGATDGNVALVAGNHYTQVASNVLAPQGDLSIIAKQVDILAGVNTEQNIQETMFKQQGVTIQVANPVISAIQAAMSLQDSKGKTKSGRSKVLADAATALTLANAAAQVSSSAAPAGGIDLAISMGSSSNQSRTEQNGTTTAASTVAAGGTTTIAAVGAGAASNLNIIGSEVTGKNIALVAENQINLIAQRNTNEEHSSNQGSSASVGVSIGTSGLMLNASASGSRGKGDGSDTTYSNTHVTASNQLSMTTGGDATLKGAVVSGQQVIADIGGNLNIESLQDTSYYKSQQQSLGGSVSVGLGRGFSGNINASQSKVDGNYQSVIEQSAINAGDGGFQINVGGNTDLKGGKIASTDKAAEEGKNQFQTASLTMSDIQNKSEYKAESQSVSAGGGYGGGKTSLNGTGVGFANESGSDSSVTTSGISGIAGDTSVRSDKDNSNALVKNWNAKELQADVEAQARIMEAFGKQAALGIGTYASMQYQKALDAGDAEGIENWKEGGAYRTALHAAAGALGGGLAGAAGATVSSLAMPEIAKTIAEMDVPDAVKLALGQVTSAALGAVVGGAGGLASAVSVEANNRQLHEDNKAKEKTLAKKMADSSNGKYTQEEIENALRSASNNTLGETASTGAVVAYDAQANAHIYDSAGMKLGRLPDGRYVLVQDPALLVMPSADLQAYIKSTTGNTYSWNTSIPQLSGTSLSPLPSIMNGIVTPEMIAERQNNAADLAGLISTEMGRFGAAATAYGTYLASQPNAVSQTGAVVQFGMAGTATAIGLGASAIEQLLRPNVGQMTVGALSDLATKPIVDRLPLYSPAINEVLEAWKNSQTASNLQDKINGKK